MDRAIQLHALISSFIATRVGKCEMTVIYGTSSKNHKKSYLELEKVFGQNVSFVDELEHGDFRKSLLFVLSKIKNQKIFFLVDDIIFTEQVNYSELINLNLKNAIFSLRLGAHLNYSYVVSKKQELPCGILELGDFLIWNWSDGQLDWAYPLSVDGHIFCTSEVLIWANCLAFRNPSSFEGELQKFCFLYKKYTGISFKKSKIVNIPANRVQNDVENLHGSIHQDDLLEFWSKGFQIDSNKFIGWTNSSAHQEAEFSFVKRLSN